VEEKPDYNLVLRPAPTGARGAPQSVEHIVSALVHIVHDKSLSRAVSRSQYCIFIATAKNRI
jgi:hypothetical protein